MVSVTRIEEKKAQVLDVNITHACIWVGRKDAGGVTVVLPIRSAPEECVDTLYKGNEKSL